MARQRGDEAKAPDQGADARAGAGGLRARARATAHPGVSGPLRELGARLREARVARDITQADLAERVGVRAHTIGRLERGEPGVAIETLARVLWIFNLVSDLRLLAGEDEEGQRLARMRAPERARGQGASRGKSKVRWSALDRI